MYLCLGQHRVTLHSAENILLSDPVIYVLGAAQSQIPQCGKHPGILSSDVCLGQHRVKFHGAENILGYYPVMCVLGSTESDSSVRKTPWHLIQ